MLSRLRPLKGQFSEGYVFIRTIVAPSLDRLPTFRPLPNFTKCFVFLPENVISRYFPGRGGNRRVSTKTSDVTRDEICDVIGSVANNGNNEEADF